MTAFVRKAGRGKVMAQRDQLAILGKLVTGFFAKFAQRDLLSGFVNGTVDLTRWHFPNCCPNGDAFLTNENDSAVPHHRRNDHGCFTVDNGPSPGERTRGRSHVVGHNSKMGIGEMRLARHSFPAVFHHGRSLVAAVLSGNCRVYRIFLFGWSTDRCSAR
jgi:hypothetical protein